MLGFWSPISRPVSRRTMANITDAIIIGQVEALLPQYLAAKAALEAAKANLEAIKSDMIRVIEQPGTVKTAWGSVTVCNGKTTYEYDRLTKAEIKLLQERAIAEGRATQKIGDNYIMVKES